jgi:hypothetical protein
LRNELPTVVKHIQGCLPNYTVKALSHCFAFSAVFGFLCLIGCATQPKLEFAKGPGPHAFDCKADPNWYNDFHIHAPNGKLTLIGVLEIAAIAEHPESRRGSSVNVLLSDKTDPPFSGVGLTGFVRADSRDKIHFTLRWGPKPTEQLPSFAVATIDDTPINFQLTLDESYQLTVSLRRALFMADKSIFVPPLKIARASLYCSGAHVRYSNVVVSPQ